MADRSSNVQGQGRPEYNLPYRSGQGVGALSLPYAPKSLDVTSPFLVGVIDVRWDNPAVYTQNNGLTVLGVNVYRTFDSPDSAYTLLNTTGPVSALYYRDQTQEIQVFQEDGLPNLTPGTGPRREWVIKTQNRPIAVPGSQERYANSAAHVTVEVDKGDGSGYQVCPAFKVRGEVGEIVLNNNRTYDAATNTFLDPCLPNTLTGGVRISYSYINTLIATDINRKVYYKATTVALDSNSTQIETPLEEVEAKSLYDMERVDYIWAEAIRRNHWILEQGGERVKLFLRKWNGQKCSRHSDDYGYDKGLDCPLCYGTSYVGGYEGPYEMIIAPPETEKSVNLLDSGLHITYDWITWTGPHPLLNDRDVVVRQNNDRFFVSQVNQQGSRGAIYQQHFQLAQVDMQDPIYSIPINGGELGVPDGHNAFRESSPSDASPVITLKPEIAPGDQLRGRTVTFENIVY